MKLACKVTATDRQYTIELSLNEARSLVGMIKRMDFDGVMNQLAIEFCEDHGDAVNQPAITGQILAQTMQEVVNMAKIRQELTKLLTL